MKASRIKFATLPIIAFVLAMIGHGQSGGRQIGPVTTVSGPSTIRAEGCVWAGVEANCLMVTDIETDTLYNVFFSGDKPAVGQRIFFTATPRYGTNMCMQGKPVDVQNWLKRKLTCSEPEHKRNPY
jgi:hypothetical protein